MTDKATLLALAERVEKADGADRVIDCLIGDVFGLARYRRDCTKPSQPARRAESKPYTASLDAAMSLIPEGTFWSITMLGNQRGGFSACCTNGGPLDWYDAAIPALALTAAALRAHASQK